MKLNSLISPLLGLALLMTGCAKTEIEYRHFSKAKVVDASKTNEEGNHQRYEHAEANQTSFRFAADSRQPDEPQATKPLESISAPSTDLRPDLKSVIHVEVGTINIHVGDVHHHIHVQTTTIVQAPPQSVIIQESISEPTPSQKSTTPATNERCERLRREYNARQAEWEKLFK